jgi:hypothetical protein
MLSIIRVRSLRNPSEFVPNKSEVMLNNRFPEHFFPVNPKVVFPSIKISFLKERKRKMKRFSWIILLLFVLVFALAACGGDDQAPAEEAPAEEAPAEEPAEEEAAEEPAEEEAMEEVEGSIWVLLPDSASSPRWETDDRRFFEQAFEAAGVEYNIVNAEGDSR